MTSGAPLLRDGLGRGAAFFGAGGTRGVWAGLTGVAGAFRGCRPFGVSGRLAGVAVALATGGGGILADPVGAAVAALFAPDACAA
jgi:hypothetical protein